MENGNGEVFILNHVLHAYIEHIGCRKFIYDYKFFILNQLGIQIIYDKYIWQLHVAEKVLRILIHVETNLKS